jgi:hypothetical protein
MDICWPCRQIDLPDDELAAVAAAIRCVIEGDRYPHAPRLDPLRAALARLEAASKFPNVGKSPPAAAPEPAPDTSRRRDVSPKAPPPAKADKRARE